ncbi:MAG: DUF1223 domain-containing protein [Alteromonadaceae bacterium]|nr:DUF1223 domain-containing protein [Alteromonadaceae bacterium]MBH85841.1 DUF1223 domain-containing protein [Alteromonadaceae bacterium]|tara:strand:- start:9535 stop:10242 length:708 start_codon:yes stop_codon:yes gene_type:complete
MLRLSILLICLLPSFVTAQEWQSGSTKTDVVELFTSEGCSSCPPADKWLSSLKTNPALFSGFIPMAFHVDYWDYIGWEDPFAKPEYTERQREYVREGHVSQSYTPGIVINSQEWRDWFRGKRTWNDDKQNVGQLKARLGDDRQLEADFNGENAGQLHVALLGMGLTTEVKAGENRGKQLSHDFVVLKMVSVAGTKDWSLSLPEIPDAGQSKTAIAVWVTQRDSLTIIQAAGGYLE